MDEGEPDPHKAFVLAAAGEEHNRETERWNRVLKAINNVVKAIRKAFRA